MIAHKLNSVFKYTSNCDIDINIIHCLYKDANFQQNNHKKK